MISARMEITMPTTTTIAATFLVREISRETVAFRMFWLHFGQLGNLR